MYWDDSCEWPDTGPQHYTCEKLNKEFERSQDTFLLHAYPLSKMQQPAGLYQDKKYSKLFFHGRVK